MAQWVKHLTLGSGPSHDLKVHEFEPCVVLSADCTELARDSVSLSLDSSRMRAYSLSK